MVLTRDVGAGSEGRLDGRVHLDEVVLHHALVAFLDSLSHPALEGHAHLGVEDVDHVLQSMRGQGTFSRRVSSAWSLRSTPLSRSLPSREPGPGNSQSERGHTYLLNLSSSRA